MHYYDPHFPYAPPAPYNKDFASDPYQGEVAYTDMEIGRLIDRLEKSGAMGKTLLVITSDHGEALGEHGEVTHGVFIYDATLKVPLIMKGPGIPEGTVISGEMGLEDLTPTVLDILGVEMVLPGQGLSQKDAIKTGSIISVGRPFFAETYLSRFDYNWSELLGLRDDGYKFIDAPRPELYNLAIDPAEKNNIYEKEKGRAEAMRREMMGWIPEEGMASAERNVEEATRKALQSLGYVGASPAAVDEEAAKRDPKDYVGMLVPLFAGFQKKSEGKWQDAYDRLMEAVEMDPVNIPIRLAATECLVEMGEHEKAVAQYRSILKDAPENTDALAGLARELSAAGKEGDAEKACRTLKEKHPGYENMPEVCEGTR